MKYHIENIFKLLGLIIIASEFKVLELLVNERTPFEDINVFPQIPLICEYLVASLTIYTIGYIIWKRFECKILGNDNSR